MALCRIRSDWMQVIVTVAGVKVGQNGEISHTAQRAIAHHSLPGLAILGHLQSERNGEPTTASS